MKRLGVFLPPPGMDVSPSQGYSLALNSLVPIHVKRGTMSIKCFAEEHNAVPWPVLKPGLLPLNLSNLGSSVVSLASWSDTCAVLSIAKPRI